MNEYCVKAPRIINEVKLIAFFKRGGRQEEEKEALEFLSKKLREGIPLKRAISKTQKRYEHFLIISEEVINQYRPYSRIKTYKIWFN